MYMYKCHVFIDGISLVPRPLIKRAWNGADLPLHDPSGLQPASISSAMIPLREVHTNRGIGVVSGIGHV